MADIKISEMTTAATLNGTEVSVLSQSQSGQLVSVKATLQAIANWFAVNAEYTSALNTTDKRICGAINELKQLISLIPQFSIEVVQVLPTEDISDTTIYLVPAEDPETGNYYEEYIHVNNAWELVGTTAVDLSDYYTKAQADGKFAVTITNTISPTTTTKKVADIKQNNVTTPVYADDADKVLRAAFGEHTVEGNPVSFDAFLGLEVAKSAEITLLPIQDTSQGDPSPTNICPISGRDSVTVTRTGVNQWDEVTEVGGISEADGSLNTNANFLRSKNPIRMSHDMTYYVYSKKGNQAVLYYYDENMNYLGFKVATNIVVTPPEDTYYARMRTPNFGTTIYENGDVSVNYPSTITDYVPYQGETHTLTFGQTIYGGKVDAVSGTLTDEWAEIASYAGETITEPWLSDRDVYTAGGTPTTGAQVVYKKATATTSSITPTDIDLLKGTNVISTDCDGLKVVYSADIKAYIDSKLNA